MAKYWKRNLAIWSRWFLELITNEGTELFSTKSKVAATADADETV